MVIWKIDMLRFAMKCGIHIGTAISVLYVSVVNHLSALSICCKLSINSAGIESPNLKLFST